MEKQILNPRNLHIPKYLNQHLQNPAKLPFPVPKRSDEKRTFILSVGSNNGSLQDPLYYSEKDAVDFSSALQSKKRHNITHSITLAGPQAQNASIMAAFKWLEASTRSQDTVYIMFSGHGFVDFKTQRYYYLSYNAQNILTDKNLLSDVWITDLVGVLRGNIKLFLDTCFSSNYNDYLFVHHPRMKATSFVSYASSASWRLSYEDTKAKNGYFTSAVLMALSGNADRNHDGNITDTELSGYINGLTPTISYGLQSSNTLFYPLK